MAARVRRARDLTLGSGSVRLPAGGGPAHAGSPHRLDFRGFPGQRVREFYAVQAAGCGAAWQRASFGTKRPPVQIRPPRPRKTRSTTLDRAVGAATPRPVSDSGSEMGADLGS